MYKKTIIISILIFSVCNCFAEKPNYVVPGELKGTGYSAHAELSWENRDGFIYEIYRSEDGNNNFSKIGESNTDNYLDFFGKPILKEQTFIYRIMPKGLPVDSKDAVKFEIKVAVPMSTDEALLDLTQRYTTRYFYDFAQRETGMARERSNDVNGDIITIGGSGFGIMALIAGAERNYFSRALLGV